MMPTLSPLVAVGGCQLDEPRWQPSEECSCVHIIHQSYCQCLLLCISSGNESTTKASSDDTLGVMTTLDFIQHTTLTQT